MTEPVAAQPAGGGAPEAGADGASVRAASIRVTGALRTIYVGSFTSFVGIAMSEVVFPLLVLGFTGKPLLAGLFGTIQFTALVLASVPVGNFVDRHDRRLVLIASEGVRAALATVLAVTLAAGHVWLVEVYLIAFILGVCQPLSGVRTLALRSIAPESELTRALSIQQAISSVAQLLGPAVGTVLFSMNRSLPFVAVAGGLSVSALCAAIARFDGKPKPQPKPTPEPTEAGTGTDAAADADGNRSHPQADPTSGDGAGQNADQTAGRTTGRDVSQDAAASQSTPESPFTGLRIIWDNPVMRGTMLFIMLINLIGVPLDLVLILQARHEGVPTHFIGLILTAFAAGGVLGAPCIPRLYKLLQPGQLLVVFGGLISLSLLMTGLFPLGGFWMAGWLAAIGFAVPAAQVLVEVLILQQVPDHQRGRVLSAVMTFMGLGMPIGAAIGGSVLQIASPTTVLCCAAVAMAGVATFAASQRNLRAARWPSAQ